MPAILDTALARARTEWGHLPGRLARAWMAGARPVRLDRPVLSMTFDDIPRSAATTGAALLERRGLRGSFYVCGGLEGGVLDGQPLFVREDLHRLHAAGHEIGCHSFTHPRLPALDAAAIGAELERNRDWLRAALPGHVPESFAFPYGAASIGARRAVARHYGVARGVHAGINRGLVDFGLLRCVCLERRVYDAEAMRRLLAQAAATRGWVVLLTHDVTPEPGPYGITPDALAATLDQALEYGFDVRPVREAAALARPARAKLRDAAAAR